MRIRALVQARLGSQRFPHKVLSKIGSLSIMEHIAARLHQLAGLGVEIVFALADEENETLREHLQTAGHAFKIGDNFNVLRRYIDAAADLEPHDFIVRVTGDNPFIDHHQLATLLRKMQSVPVDYGYTADLPLGMGSEVVRVNALRSIQFRSESATADNPSPILPHHEEHVTIFLRENPHLYEIYPQPLDNSFSPEAAKARVAGIRLTIDEPDDLVVAQRVYEHFNRLGNPLFSALDIIQLAKNNPDMLAGNQHIEQNSAQIVDRRR